MNKYSKSHYQAYLMRFWEEQQGDEQHPGVWRFTLEDPHSGQRLGFGSLDAFVGFLER